MTSQLSEFEQFIIWFSELDDPSVDIFEKKKFLDHILEIGEIDEKAAQYIAHVLEKLSRNEKEKIRELQKRIEGLRNIQQGQKTPELSLTHKIAEIEGKKMMAEAERFAQGITLAQKEKATQAESSERDTEEENIAALKAAL
jgi:hypothetical protein